MRRRGRFLLRSKHKDPQEEKSSGLGTKDELSTIESGCTSPLDLLWYLLAGIIGLLWFDMLKVFIMPKM